MKILNCPLNGPRNISEFVWGGETRQMPDPATASDEQWTGYLFLEENIAGEITEWWLHVPTNYWFIARRNTLTDEIIETMTHDAFLDRQRAMVAPPPAREAGPAADPIPGGGGDGAP